MARELVTNPGAEVDTADWGVWSNCTLARDVTNPKSGVGYFKLTATGVNPYVGIQSSPQDAPTQCYIVPGRTLQISVGVRPTASGNYHLHVGNGPSTWTADGPSVPLTAGQWSTLTLTCKRPTSDGANPPNLIVSLWNDSGNYAINDVVGLDEISVQEQGLLARMRWFVRKGRR